jgi:hypothetical protein
VEEKRCGNCKFYDFFPQRCRRLPPQLVADSNYDRDAELYFSTTTTEWPNVRADDWCGEWKRIDEMEEE